jgi:uncharacterized protein YdeI (YjbR/CyaY-like superfamily)
MKKAKRKKGLKRIRQPMPSFVRAALTKERLLGAYRARPPYQRNDYLWWINSAKLDATKQKRLRRMLKELTAGHGYMGMDWQPERRK